MKYLSVVCLVLLLSNAACTNDSNSDVLENELWIERFAGLQCQRPDFDDINEVLFLLEFSGINTFDSQTRNDITTCEACGCPAGPLFIIQIDESDSAKAARLGFTKSLRVQD